MQKYRYRHPRVSVNLPVNFVTPNLMISGRCTEISEEGMRLELPRRLQYDTCGKVSLRYRDRTLEFNVRVASVGGTHAGMEFLCATSDEKNELTQLVASLTAPQDRLALVLVRGCT